MARFRVLGLRSRADDYLVKPFEVEELLARLDALTRRTARSSRLVIGELTIDRLDRRCTLRGTPMDLTILEYELLLRLAIADGTEAVSRASLFRYVWHLNRDPGSGVLEVLGSRLREKLGRDWIETVRGLGYRLRRVP